MLAALKNAWCACAILFYFQLVLWTQDGIQFTVYQLIRIGVHGVVTTGSIIFDGFAGEFSLARQAWDVIDIIPKIMGYVGYRYYVPSRNYSTVKRTKNFSGHACLHDVFVSFIRPAFQRPIAPFFSSLLGLR